MTIKALITTVSHFLQWLLLFGKANSIKPTIFKITFMKSGLLMLALVVIFSSGGVFAQQKLTKAEILNECRKNRTMPDINSIFRLDIHAKTRGMLDNLIKSRVDTLVVYSVSFPGYDYIGKPDSCANRDQVNSHFFWKNSGKYLYRETDERCEARTDNVDGDVVKFAVNKYSEIAREFFMDAVSGGERHGERVILKQISVNHEPKYSILVVIGDQYNYLTFTENGLTNNSSLFLNYNKGLTSFRLFELIKTQVGND
jgi:hypothetical protein